jgi:SAM-dependent methyltransferase
VGHVAFGDLRRLEPISRDWGFERGTVIDRYYIDRFMERHADDVRGRGLEVGTNALTRRYGSSRVERQDVLHVADSGPPVTVVGDLSTGIGIPVDSFDCVIATQTLNFIYDVPAAVRTLHAILRPGGVALVTVPGITKISRYDMDRWGQFWSFTSRSARQLFEEAFRADHLTVEVAGIVLAATAFLQGLAAEELSPEELDLVDPEFETLIAVRAARRAAAG